MKLDEAIQNNVSNPLNISSFTLHDSLEYGRLTELNDKEALNLVPIFITCGVLMAVGIGGNSLVLHVYLRKMQSSAKKTFIVVLALLDLIVCVVVIPCEMYDLRNQVLFTQDELCKGMRFLEYATVLSAGFVLVAVSFERYYFLCKAFEEFTAKKAKYVCIACVVCAIIVAMPSAIIAGSKTRHFPGTNITGSECSLNSDHNVDEKFKRFYYYFLTAIFMACVICFIVIYSLIGSLLWKYHSGRLDPKNMDRHSLKSSMLNLSNPSINIHVAVNQLPNPETVDNSSANSDHSGSTKSSRFFDRGKRFLKSARTVIVFFSVTVVFVVSFLPHIVMRIMMFLDFQFEYDKATNNLLYNFIVRSYLLSNVANPFIYSIFNKSFRNELKRTFKSFGISRKVTLTKRCLPHGTKDFV